MSHTERIIMDMDKRVSQFLSSKPVVPDYSNKWSRHGRNLKHQLMREGIKTITDKTISLDSGQPNMTLSPVAGMTVELSDGRELTVDRNLLKKLARYNDSDGLPELKQLLLDIQRQEHRPPTMEDDNQPTSFDLSVTCGSTDGLHSCMKTFLDEEDTILMEGTNYISFIMNLKTHEKNIQGVPFDGNGMVPEALEDILSNWSQQHPNKPIPKILYAVTSSSNPIGYNWSLSRMLDVYLICRKYDLLIVDDGAYHFLQFGQRPRSFQSLDVDGRVMRFDSFSKIMGAGYRLGWVSGPAVIIDKHVINQELTCVHPSILSQIIIYSLLKNWGPDGFETRVRTVSNFYKNQAESLMGACNKYLKDLATWTVPTGGMFTWITFKECVSDNATDVARELNVKENIRLLSGVYFQTEPSDTSRSLRVCYSSASQDAFVTGIKCLADLLQRGVQQNES